MIVRDSKKTQTEVKIGRWKQKDRTILLKLIFKFVFVKSYWLPNSRHALLRGISCTKNPLFLVIGKGKFFVGEHLEEKSQKKSLWELRELNSRQRQKRVFVASHSTNSPVEGY